MLDKIVKCYAITFVKVDAQIEEERWRIILLHVYERFILPRALLKETK